MAGKCPLRVGDLVRRDDVNERLERPAGVAVAREGAEHGQADVLRDVVGQKVPGGVGRKARPRITVCDDADPGQQGLDLGLAAGLRCSGETAEIRRRTGATGGGFSAPGASSRQQASHEHRTSWSPSMHRAGRHRAGCSMPALGQLTQISDRVRVQP